ncbi:MAG: DUF3788 domain-containing protein [Bacteroidetes bacterium]|nr:DUF3788 domain-containing protein [Bacteroidota bacterium]MBT3424719.1 DUF3788 domain-containing protein [Bacteroidota bacterium]MBT3799862.1 DUF3788 domain-containing protein [Bacteroidota bacterium]MBT4728189.1 DUF3788 domain-containing protein [Bacteroidota bacterium]MBT7040828.1 DUF3788 domain-containing protein [Bacteroidota bacterium]
MDDISIFQDKAIEPIKEDLAKKLNTTDSLWAHLHDFVLEKYPNGLTGWNYPGKKYGWSYRIKDKKRAIIYFLPRDGYFKVAFVFGEKAFNEILNSTISDEIKKELSLAKKYAEGRGIRIEVKNEIIIEDIKKLIEIKLAN